MDCYAILRYLSSFAASVENALLFLSLTHAMLQIVLSTSHSVGACMISAARSGFTLAMCSIKLERMTSGLARFSTSHATTARTEG